MPQPNLNASMMEWMFTSQEAIQAQLLPEITILWLKTKYARMLAQTIQESPPILAEMDREYLMHRAELGGKLAMITEIIQDHVNAVNAVAENPDILQQAQAVEGQSLEQRAASFVNNSNTQL